MSVYVPPERPPTRSRTRWILLAMLASLIVGAVLAWYALRIAAQRWPDWVGSTTPQPVVSAPATTPPVNRAPVTAMAAAVDPQVLALRTAALSAQLAALEARTAGIDSDVAGAAGQAARGEALLVAFAARRAIDRGAALGYLEGQLQSRFASVRSAAVAQVIEAARRPLTLDMLRAGLDAASPELLGEGRGWTNDIAAGVRRLVVIHEAGSPSPLPRARLDQARRLLDLGQVAPALAVVERLPGAARTGAWRQDAARYLATRRALDVLEGTALLGQARSDMAAQAPPVDVR